MTAPGAKYLNLLLFFAILLGSGGADAPATAPDSNPIQLIAGYQHILDQWKPLPVLPARSTADVVTFTEDRGLLVANWPILRSGAVSGRIPLTDLPGQSKIECPSLATKPTNLFPIFDYYDITQPDHVCRHLQILNSSNRLQVVQDSESVSRFQSVSLIEAVAVPDDPPITLRVQILQGSQKIKSEVFSAPTLPILRREHPLEFDEFLRPMFREFHQEQAVFAVDARIAWQVLADAWQCPPDLPGHVRAVIEKLDSPDFARRQHADRALRSLGEPAALYLRSADRRAWTPEQSARIDNFLAGYFPLSDDQVKKLGDDPSFLLDCMSGDDPTLRAAALNRLNRVLGRKIGYNPDQPIEERNIAIERLREQLIPVIPAPQTPDASQ